MRIKILIASVLASSVINSSVDAHIKKDCERILCKKHVVKPFKPKILRIAWCESRQRWYIDSQYDGGLQFSPSTWNKTGSNYSFAYQAPPLEQMYRAVIWASMIGWRWHSTAGWPVCG